MNNSSIVDVLIENIKTDQDLLEGADQQIEKAKEEKRAVVDRLKNYRKDLSVLLKYSDSEQQKKIQELGIDFSNSERELNPIAQVAFDTVMKTKDAKISNGALYEAYKKTVQKEEDVISYTDFNIKCRSLFNTQRLLRKKGKDPKNSREDIITLNGSVMPKTTEVANKAPQTKK